MLYRMAADMVVAFHAAFVVFVVVGGLLCLRWPRAIWLHLPAVVWGVFIEFAGWICPLTPLENFLRAQASETTYQGGFIQRYLLAALYPADLTRRVQFVLGGLALLVNLVVYALIAKRRIAARTSNH